MSDKASIDNKETHLLRGSSHVPDPYEAVVGGEEPARIPPCSGCPSTLDSSGDESLLHNFIKGIFPQNDEDPGSQNFLKILKKTLDKQI